MNGLVSLGGFHKSSESLHAPYLWDGYRNGSYRGDGAEGYMRVIFEQGILRDLLPGPWPWAGPDNIGGS